MTAALEGVRGQRHAPAALYTPGKTRYPLCRGLDGPQGPSGQVRKISPPPGFDSRTVQPVASRYTDYSTRPTKYVTLFRKSEERTWIWKSMSKSKMILRWHLRFYWQSIIRQWSLGLWRRGVSKIFLCTEGRTFLTNTGVLLSNCTAFLPTKSYSL